MKQNTQSTVPLLGLIDTQIPGGNYMHHMHWFLSFLVFGGLWFWLVAAFETIILFIAIAMEEEGGVLATVSIVVTTLLMAICGGPNVFRYTAQHPKRALIYFCSYLVAGTIWAVIKWCFHVFKLREKYIDARRKFLRSKNISGDQMPPELKKDWQREMPSWLRNDGKPDVTQHKSEIIFWMTYWPVSLIWTCIDDIVKKLFEHIFNVIRSSLQGISDRAFKIYDEDTKA